MMAWRRATEPACWLEPRHPQHLTEHALRREALARDLRGVCARAGVVGLDRSHRGGGLLERPEGVQPGAERQDVPEARVLLDDGASRGEVGGGPVAEPAAPESDVQVLRDGEFAARSAEVVA